MSRLSLVLVAAALAAPASGCKAKGGDAGTAGGVADPVGDTGGKVLEVAGQVTVAGKQLAVGDLLKPEDEITTGADGKVVLELTHNLAHWSLGPSRTAKLNTSIAWKLPRNTGNSQVVIQDLTAAGRPAERSAAEGAASSTAPAAPGAAAPESAPAPAAPAPAPVMQTAKAAAPMPPPPMQPAVGGKMDAAAPGGDGLGGVGSVGGGGGGGAGAGAGLTRGGSHAAHASAAAPDAATLVANQESALKKCIAGGTITLHVAVDAAGIATTTVDGAAADVTACIKKVIATLKLPAAKANVNMTIER